MKMYKSYSQKTLLTIGFLALINTSLLNAQDKKVLFLGNSYTFFNELPILFKSLASSGGYEVHTDFNTPGGCTLSNPSNGHLYNQESLSKIQSENWDYVILQEQSQYPVIPYWRDNYFYPGAKSLDSLIKLNDTCTSTLLFMTWGRKYGGQQCINGHCSTDFADFNQMTDSLSASYLENAREIDAAVSPVGIAWKNALAENDQIELFVSDGSHPSEVGTYLAACTFYASIFHESPVGLKFYSTLDTATASFLQQIASTTVFESLGLWNIDTADVSASFEYQIEGQTVIFLNNSINADAYLWNFGDGTTDTIEHPSHEYNEPGIYNVILTAYKSCDTSSTSQFINIVLQSTSNQSIPDEQISIYPNPVVNFIAIHNTSLDGLFDFSIIDSTGKTVIHDQIFFRPGEEIELNIKGLNPGLYFLRVSKDKYVVSRKVYIGL